MLYQVNGVSVEQLSHTDVVQLMRSLPQGPVILQVSRQETRQFNDDSISVLEVSYNHVIQYYFHGSRYQQLNMATTQLLLILEQEVVAQ